MAKVIYWCKHCHNVFAMVDDPEIKETKNDYSGYCNACIKKGYGKKNDPQNGGNMTTPNGVDEIGDI